MKDIYTLKELISALMKIKKDGDGALNFPKAFMTLALEIEKLQKSKSNEKT